MCIRDRSIVDNGNATAITIGSDETTTFSNEVIVQEAASPTLKLDTTSAATSAATLNLEGYRTSGDIGALVKINAINARDGDTHAALHIYANGDTNGYFRFNNTANTQIARLDTDGLKFGSDTAAANALDDYEEGSFTPTIGSGTVSAASGQYTKIGRLVSFNLFVGGFSDTSGTGAIQIGIPPFTTQSATQSHIVVMTRYFDLSHRSITGYLTDNGSIMTLYQNGNGANNWEQLSHDNLSSGSAYV